MKSLILLLFMTIFLLGAATTALPKTVYANNHIGCADAPTFFLGLPAWYKYLELDSNCEVVGPHQPGSDKLDWQQAGSRIGLAVIELMLRIATMAAIAYVIYGGFRYITSQGEPDSVKSARQTITNGLIGMVISLIATGLVAFIASQLT
jgi:hypothetical protein